MTTEEIFSGKWVSLEDVTALLVEVFREKTVAEEKNVEYAKLVAAQAEEYAEKLAGKVLVDRKRLEDLMKRQPLPEAFQWIADFKSQYQHWTKKLKELLEGSTEDLNLALAFSDVRMKKKGSGSDKNE